MELDRELAQVFLGVTTNRRLLVNSSGRAQIKTGQSCGVSVPLTAILYGSAGTVVQVVRRARVEKKFSFVSLCLCAFVLSPGSGLIGRSEKTGYTRFN